MSAGASAPTATLVSTTTTAGITPTTSADRVTTSTSSTPPTTVVGKSPPDATIPVADPAAVAAAARRFCDLSTGYLEQVREIQISLSSPDRVRALLEAAAPAAAESVTIASKEVGSEAIE